MNSKSLSSILVSLLLAGSVNATFVTFQEGVSGYTGTQDSYIDGVSGRQNDNNGASETIAVRCSGAADSDLVRELYNTVIRFENISVTNSETIVGATLTLTYKGTSGTYSAPVLHAYALQTNWNESEVTWSNATSSTLWQQAGAKGATDRGDLLGSVSIDLDTIAVGDKVVVKLSANLVKSWIDNPASNFGVVLNITDASYKYPQINFESSESTAGTDTRPLLTIETMSGTILQEGLHGYAGTRDSYIDGVSGRQNNNYGTGEELFVWCGGELGTALEREAYNTVIRFNDIDTLVPQNTRITNATLTLTYNGTSGVYAAPVLHAYALQAGWNESEVTWSNATSATLWQQAGAQGSSDRGTLQDDVSLDLASLSVGDKVVIDLSTDLVKGWFDNPSANVGILLTITDATYKYPSVKFISSESTAGIDKRPRLRILSDPYKGTVIAVR